MKREREEERQIQELQRLQEASGKPKQHNRVDWMYQAPSSATGHYSEEMEGYLLGKRRIDGILLKNDTDNQKLEKGADVVGAHAAAAAGPSIGSQRDTMLKVMADPLLEIRKREQAAQEAAMKEAIRRKEREEKRGARDGDRDRDRRHRGDRDRDHDSKRRRYSDDAEDDRRHRNHRSSRRHRSRSPYSPERSSRRHRSERDRDDDRERRHDDTRPRNDDRTRNRSRDRHDREKDSHGDRRRDRDDRRDRDRDHDRSSGRPRERERERDRSPRRSSDQQPSSEDRNGRGSRENYRRGRDFNNQRNGSYGRDRAPPSRPAQNKPDPKELEQERQRKLAEMQSNANNLETDRRQRITEIDAQEEEQREADDKQRSDRGRFMSQVHKRVGEDSLDERIRRSRGGLSKMDEE